jgi:hypothetical protein
MVKKAIAFFVTAALTVLTLSTTVMAAPVAGKLKVDWYTLGDGTAANKGDRPWVEGLRDSDKLDQILDLSKVKKSGELTNYDTADTGLGLLFLEGDKFKAATQTALGLGSGAETDFFGMVISGILTPAEAGTYKFKFISDDNARFKLGNDWIIDFWGTYYLADANNPNSEKKTWDKEIITSGIALEAGKPYDIRAEYWDGWGGNNLKIEWSKDNGATWSKIPSSVLSYDPDAKAPVTNPTTKPDTDTDTTPKTSDASMLITLVVAGAAAFGGLKLKKK